MPQEASQLLNSWKKRIDLDNLHVVLRAYFRLMTLISIVGDQLPNAGMQDPVDLLLRQVISMGKVFSTLDNWHFEVEQVRLLLCVGAALRADSPTHNEGTLSDRMEFTNT